MSMENLKSSTHPEPGSKYVPLLGVLPSLRLLSAGGEFNLMGDTAHVRDECIPEPVLPQLM